MTKPTIELKNVKIHTGLSEETPCYTAKLLVNGKYFADLRNDGHGGCDMIDPPKGTHFNDPAFNKDLKALEVLIGETFPAHDMSKYDMSPMKESLEVICHTLAWEFVDQRNFRSKLSRKVMALKDGKIIQWSGKKTEEFMDVILDKHPEAIILNRLTFAAAWEIAKENS